MQTWVRVVWAGLSVPGHWKAERNVKCDNQKVTLPASIQVQLKGHGPQTTPCIWSLLPEKSILSLAFLNRQVKKGITRAGLREVSVILPLATMHKMREFLNKFYIFLELQFFHSWENNITQLWELADFMHGPRHLVVPKNPISLQESPQRQTCTVCLSCINTSPLCLALSWHLSLVDIQYISHGLP